MQLSMNHLNDSDNSNANNNSSTMVEFLLCLRHCAKDTLYMNSFNPYNNKQSSYYYNPLQNYLLRYLCFHILFIFYLPAIKISQSLTQCWWYNLVQLLWKAGKHLINLNIYMTQCLTDTRADVSQKIYTRMFISSFFITAKNWKQLSCPSHLEEFR